MSENQMTEEELRSRWITHIIHFADWSKEKNNQDNNINNNHSNLINKEK
jgi:hypothetical protein